MYVLIERVINNWSLRNKKNDISQDNNASITQDLSIGPINNFHFLFSSINLWIYTPQFPLMTAVVQNHMMLSWYDINFEFLKKLKLAIVSLLLL